MNNVSSTINKVVKTIVVHTIQRARERNATEKERHREARARENTSAIKINGRTSAINMPFRDLICYSFGSHHTIK